MAEAECRMKGHVPSLDEYMAVTVPSFGLGPITFTSFCLLGPEHCHLQPLPERPPDV